MGSQRTEIVNSIFGLDSFDSGEIYFLGKKVRFNSPYQAVNKSIGFLPEDRKRDGIINTMSVKDNIIMSILSKISKFGWIDCSRELGNVKKQIHSLDIKVISPYQNIVKLSGGNQQKVILARLLTLNPKLLILDEPTRGIDIGAKKEVHKIISSVVNNGVAIIMISSELPEILGVSDRIIVLNYGRIAGAFSYKEATQEKIMALASKKLVKYE
jgi:ribose transport system ATP-binding protein